MRAVKGKDATLTGWTVLLRGVRYRAGRSLVVLVLAAIAVTAAVLTPAYARAAAQSVLTDRLISAPDYATSLTVSAQGPGSAALEPSGETSLVVMQALNRLSTLRPLVGAPVASVETPLQIANGSLKARYVYRSDACRLLRVTGDCPTSAGEVLVSERTAKAHGLAEGDKIEITLAGKQQQRTIAGTYTPINVSSPAWGVHAYFLEGGPPDSSDLLPIDAVFAGDEEDIKAVPTSTVAMELVYPVKVADVRQSGVKQLRKDIDQLGVATAASDLTLTSALNNLLYDAQGDQAAIAKTIPVVAVPLLLLVVGVLMLLVATLTEERGPEIALAKLRGYGGGKASRFGLGEVLFLIVLGTPIGLVAGLAVTEVAARSVLAPGVHVELRWEPFAAAVGALVVAFAAAWLASRRTVRSGVLSLLRRVPHRGGWRAGVGEGVASALAVAALLAAWNDRSSPLALLAAPLTAIVAGILAGRLLGAMSTVRMVMARNRGNVATMLAAAQLSRRPGRHRVVTVITVALALLAFSATAWDVAAAARVADSQETMGADHVYSVTNVDPQLLTAAVRQAAPDGSAMPVLRHSERYADDSVEIIAVPAGQLSKVAIWPGHDAADLKHLGELLHPPAPKEASVSGEIRVRVTTTVLPRPVRLAAIVAVQGVGPRYVTLGTMTRGTHVYSGEVPEGRFVGLALVRPAGETAGASVQMDVLDISSNGRQVVPLTDQTAWTGSQRGVDGGVEVAAGTGLKVNVSAQSTADVIVSYIDTPTRLPVALSGEAPDDNRGATDFQVLAFADEPQQFTVVERSSALPRAGDHGMIVDLDYALKQAEATSGITDSTRFSAEVWAAPNAPADLDKRLASVGVTVTQKQTIAQLQDQLGRRAPALAWRLYLLAGVVAALLALGLVLLVARLGARERRHELAALRVTGVSARTLRRGVRREHLALLGLPVLVGFAVGLGSAFLMLPGMPLVTVGTVSTPDWTPGAGALAFAAGAGLLSLVLAVIVAVRLVRRAAPELLRGDV
jgi:putative ABC transport system permease protein